MDSNRDEFLVEMYRQMFNDINRNINVVWQSVGVLIGAFAILALVEKNVISSDIAVSIIILLCGWMFAHIVDSNYWYNRNLAIIANIERQFLRAEDLKEIHYYFGSHRQNNAMLRQLQIQIALGAGLGALVLLFHFSSRVLPGMLAVESTFEFQRCLPYISVAASGVYLYWLVGNRAGSYREFIEHSPGREVDTTGIVYGVGHGFGPSFLGWLFGRKRKQG